MPKLVHHTSPKYPAHHQESWLLQQATLSPSPWISRRALRTKTHSQTKRHHGTTRTSSTFTIQSRKSSLGPMISTPKTYGDYIHEDSRIAIDNSDGGVRIQRNHICNTQSTCNTVLASDVTLVPMESLCGMITSRMRFKMVILTPTCLPTT